VNLLGALRSIVRVKLADMLADNGGLGVFGLEERA